MATRHQSRTVVVSLLYAYDVGNENIESFSEDILEDKKIRNKQKEFALKLFNGTIKHLNFIDEKIEKHLKEWSLNRLGSMERSILRLAAYEIIIEKTNEAIIINEALELSKEFASDQSPKFINGVLDAISKESKKTEEHIDA
jgi:N utilization substance protein B